MKYYNTIEQKLKSLKDDFPSFLQKKNDYTHGRIVDIRQASPEPSIVRGFCEGKETDLKDEMAMRIMFHGTHQDSITPILNDGIHETSYFTHSFHYAVTRSLYKQNYKGDARVLAFAVLVEEKDRFNWEEVNTRSPCRYHALPIFVVAVRKNN